eukprot:scaffold199263_cov23-Cyclotella_meneghiniana.AAC.1
MRCIISTRLSDCVKTIPVVEGRLRTKSGLWDCVMTDPLLVEGGRMKDDVTWSCTVRRRRMDNQ